MKPRLLPLEHALHQASLVLNSRLYVRHEESHLGSLGAAEEILDVLLALWSESGNVNTHTGKRQVATHRQSASALESDDGDRTWN